MSKRVELPEIGEKYGEWTVTGESFLRPYGKQGRLKRATPCRCSCGRTSDVDLANLNRGESLKCIQCAANERGLKLRREALEVGTTYGSWIVLGPSEKHGYTRCKCSCGKESDVQSKNLVNGDSLGCHPCSHKKRILEPHKVKIRTYLNAQGYRMCTWRAPSGAKVSVTEHRIVMEGMIGRELVAGENVHHKNGNRSDNRPENLELWNTSQPAGQRIPDKVAYGLEMLRLYAPEFLMKSAPDIVER